MIKRRNFVGFSWVGFSWVRVHTCAPPPRAPSPRPLASAKGISQAQVLSYADGLGLAASELFVFPREDAEDGDPRLPLLR